jgi:hypothetical protein
MTFDPPPDDDLSRAVRHRLHDHADTLTLEPSGPEAVMTRVRHRRLRRQGIAGAFAVLALVGAAVLMATNRSLPVTAGDDPATTAPAGPLPDATPVRLAWSQKPDGLMGSARGSAETGAGTMYQLSTAPGVSYKDHPDGVVPATVYRLADDGTWVPTATPEATPRFSTIAAGDNLLYGVSTAPGANGTSVPLLSTSSDGGATWRSTPVAMPAPPSRTLPWKLVYQADVAHVPGATAASVNFTFELPYDWYKAHTEPGATVMNAEVGPEGLVVRGLPPGSLPGSVQGPSGTTPGTVGREAMQQVLATVTWSELGVTGPDAIGTHTRVFLADGEQWTEVDGGPRLDLTNASLTAIGDDLVLTSLNGMMGPGASRIVASSDGRRWREIENPGVTALTGVGPVWVGFAPLAGENQLHVSEDRGATWRTLALNDIDPRLVGTRVQGIDGGPLGLFLTAFGEAPTDGFLVTTRDLHSWTLIPSAEVLGQPGLALSQIAVGRDRVVVTGYRPSTVQPAPLETVTAVGTPTRS